MQIYLYNDVCPRLNDGFWKSNIKKANICLPLTIQERRANISLIDAISNYFYIIMNYMKVNCLWKVRLMIIGDIIIGEMDNQ